MKLKKFVEQLQERKIDMTLLKRKTNLDKIKEMNAEEMAKTIKEIAINYLFDNMIGNKEIDIKEWLESECENNV